MTRRSMLLGAAALVAASLVGRPAAAHRLIVFATVEGDEVVVRARFSSGRTARLGDVRVFDGEDALLLETTLSEDGEARFPLDRDAAAEGLRIVVTAGDGHEDEWILTPNDIAAPTEAAQ